MARGRRVGTPATRVRPQRAGTRGATAAQVPVIYQEMLAEAASSPTVLNDDGRSIKKRRIGGRIVIKDENAISGARSDAGLTSANATEEDTKNLDMSGKRQQTAYNDSDDSTDDDMAWEEVLLEHAVNKDEDSPEVIGELNLVLGGQEKSSKRSIAQRRKPITTAERKMRLEIHKMHLMCLLVHGHLRNHWCNDEEVQKAVRKLLPKKTLSYLEDDERQSQFQRSRSFMDGLEQACEIFRSRFKITARGISRSYWAEDAEHPTKSAVPDDIDLLTSISDFRATATKLEASRDIGAQLFCAMLRSAGVEARLVCSLQPLPFTTATKGTTPVKPRSAIRVSYPDTRIGISDDDSGIEAGSDTSVRTTGSKDSTGATVSRIRSRLATRLGRPQQPSYEHLISTPPLVPKKPQRKQFRESPFPIYWVEVFNTAVQKWVAVDALVTKTIAKSTKLEPPASDIENNMCYVIAFERDGSARDVTRRYAKAYNAKTRKTRIEFTKGGERWWRRVLRIYKRVLEIDRDQVEEAELASKEAAEGMPRNVQDFKDHPYYALERHLRRNEIIEPKREVGKVTTGRTNVDVGKALEPIYRRRDVHMVKSADGWYRVGREIKVGEQPLKRVPPRRRIEAMSDTERDGEEDGAGTAMYSAFQTQAYLAPPVIRGIIPKNAYGNLDIYTPSMIPPGGVYIAHPDTARAARVLGIDCSDAVTGFEFKGRHGTAVIRGAVVALEYQEAVEEVIRGFEYERAEAEEMRRSLEALKMWRRFLAGLRIRQRIEGYVIEGDQDTVADEMQHPEDIGMDEGEGGGFLPVRDEDAMAEPTADRTFQPFLNDEFSEDGGFVAEDSDGGMEDAHDQDGASSSDSTLPIGVHHHENGIDHEGGYTDMVEKEREENGEVGNPRQKAITPHQIEERRPVHEEQPQTPVTAIKDKSEQTTPHTNLKDYLYDSTASISECGVAENHGFRQDELEEATMLQQIHESAISPTSPELDMGVTWKSEYGLPQPASTGKDEQQIQSLPIPMNERKVLVLQDVAQTSPRITAGESQEGSHVLDEDSEIEKSSLLSHDPEDEDADPEWLV